MSELKMRDALITVREVLVLEGYAEDNLAVVKIDEALAHQPAAEMDCKCSLRTKLAGDGCEVCNPERHEDSAVVELTKCEGCNGHGEVGGLLPGDGGYESNPCPFCQPIAVELTDYELNDISMLKTGYPITVLGRVLARAVIAAHEAKKNGGGV